MKIKFFSFLLFIILIVNCSNSNNEYESINNSNTSIEINTPEIESTGNTNLNTKQNNSPVEKQNGQDKDDESIIGTWKHISSAKTPGGKQKPLTEADILWTFNQDGTGNYKQIVNVVKGGDGKKSFNWKLKGKDIILSPGKISYTIVEQKFNQMVWKNNVLGDYYIVEKQ